MKGWMKKAGALCLSMALSACMMTSCTPAYANYELELVSKPTMTVQGFDEKTGMFYCQMDLDEDDMSRFLAGARWNCPYFRFT